MKKYWHHTVDRYTNKVDIFTITLIIMLSTFLTSAVIALAPVEDPAPALEKYTLMTPDIYHTITRPIDSLVKKQQLSTKYTQRDEIMQEIRIEQILEEIENLSDTIEDLLIALHEEEIELTKDECLYLITTDLELIDFTFNNDEIWETKEGLQKIERKIAEIKRILALLAPR